MLKTKDRLKHFKWVDKILPVNYYLVGLKSKTFVKPKSINDLKQYTIAVIREDIRHLYFKKSGFIDNKNLLLTSSLPQQLHLLNVVSSPKKGTVIHADLIPLSSVALKGFCGNPKNILKDIIRCSDLVTIYKIPNLEESLYAAYSLTTDDTIVERTKKELQKLKDNGTHKKLLKEFL